MELNVVNDSAAVRPPCWIEKLYCCPVTGSTTWKLPASMRAPLLTHVFNCAICAFTAAILTASVPPVCASVICMYRHSGRSPLDERDVPERRHRSDAGRDQHAHADAVLERRRDDEVVAVVQGAPAVRASLVDGPLLQRQTVASRGVSRLGGDVVEVQADDGSRVAGVQGV